MKLSEAIEVLQQYTSMKSDPVLYSEGREVVGISVVAAQPPFVFGPEPRVNGVEIQFNTNTDAG